MQIFCDESGGIDQGRFLATAVRIDGAEAVRVVKTIRKLLRLDGPELKGNDLNVAQIEAMFSVISRYPAVMAISIVCHRDDPVGGWAVGALQEHQIWRELIVESCLPLHHRNVRGIVPDGGRYKKAILRAMEAEIAEAVARRGALPRIPVGCANSVATPGIQIADVVSNTVYRATGGYPDAQACRRILAAAATTGQVRVAALEMTEIRPVWLEPFRHDRP